MTPPPSLAPLDTEKEQEGELPLQPALGETPGGPLGRRRTLGELGAVPRFC